MLFSIMTSVSANSAYASFNKNSRSIQENLLKIGSGLRVSSAKDDAASSAIASGLASDLAGFEKALLNTSQAASLLKTMESGVDQATSIVQRIEGLSIQAQSSTLSAKNRTTLQNEVSGLLVQLDKFVNTTSFSGVPLLNGSTTTNAYNPFQTEMIGNSTPSSNVFPEGVTYSFDNSVKSTAIEVNYTASADGCSGGVLSMVNLETGASQKLSVITPASGSTTYSFDQLGASVTIDESFGDQTFEYGLNTATTPGVGQILENSSGDVNCLGVTTVNNNIAIIETTGMISDIASTSVTISGSVSQSATFTLPASRDQDTGATNGDFVANNVDLSTKGKKDIVLSRTRMSGGASFTDSITLQLTVITPFTAGDVSAETSLVDLAQLQNTVIADSKLGDNSTLSFQVNTSSVGSVSDNQFQLSVPSISSRSLGIDKIDVTNIVNGSQNLDKIRSALENLDLQRSNVGVAQGQIEILQKNIEVSIENSTAARSSLIDLDFAKGVMELTNSTVRMQASQQALSRANSMQEQLIQLLGR